MTELEKRRAELEKSKQEKAKLEGSIILFFNSYPLYRREKTGKRTRTLKERTGTKRWRFNSFFYLFNFLAAETPETKPTEKPMTELEKRRAELEKSKKDKLKLEGIYKLFELI
jgi:hypothetical protein